MMKLDPMLNSSNDLNSIQYKMKEYSSKKGRMGGCKHKIRMIDI